jgi:hypothetical protein
LHLESLLYSLRTQGYHVGQTLLFECRNEPNDRGSDTEGHPSFWPGYWHAPLPDYYWGSLGPSAQDTITALETLYARFCDVAAFAARKASDSANVLVGGLGGVHVEYPNDAHPNCGLVSGVHWLEAYGDQHGHSTGDTANAGVTAHPYQYGTDDGWVVDGETLAYDMDLLRGAMQEGGERDKQLWATEMGWGPSADTWNAWRAPFSIPSSHIVGLAGSPTSFVDKIFWFCLCDPMAGGSALLKSDTADPQLPMQRKPCYYAYRQMTQELLNKRLNGRVQTGNPAGAGVFLYEFEDPASSRKTWVGWRTWHPACESVVVKVPTRTDEADKVRLWRGPGPDSGRALTPPDGWLHPALDSVPVYIHEIGNASRPDLVVDSIWTEPEIVSTGARVRLFAKLRNIENVATPETLLTVCFYADGDKIDLLHGLSIPAHGEITCSTEVLWTPTWPGKYLLKVVANPGIFMELDFDNNTRYLGKGVTIGGNMGTLRLSKKLDPGVSGG